MHLWERNSVAMSVSTICANRDCDPAWTGHMQRRECGVSTVEHPTPIKYTSCSKSNREVQYPILRESFSGRMSAFQADHMSSNLFSRSCLSGAVELRNGWRRGQ